MDERIRWASKVGQAAIRRLYQTDALSYGEGSTPGVRETQAEWREKVSEALQVRRGGG
jgi:hypothetical protein